MPAGISNRSNTRTPLRALAAGALAVIGLYAVMKVVKVYDVGLGQYRKLAISLTIFFLGGFAGGRVVARDGVTLRSFVVAFGSLLLGVAAGVIFWNGLEDYVFSRFGESLYQERKLFPIDVMLLWMLGWAPLLVGLAAGTMLRRRAEA